jgi:hypothetical protein
VFIVESVYFVIDSVRKLLDTPPYAVSSELWGCRLVTEIWQGVRNCKTQFAASSFKVTQEENTVKQCHGLLGYDTVQWCGRIPTLLSAMLPPSSGRKGNGVTKFRWTCVQEVELSHNLTFRALHQPSDFFPTTAKETSVIILRWYHWSKNVSVFYSYLLS